MNLSPVQAFQTNSLPRFGKTFHFDYDTTGRLHGEAEEFRQKVFNNGIPAHRQLDSKDSPAAFVVTTGQDALDIIVKDEVIRIQGKLNGVEANVEVSLTYKGPSSTPRVYRFNKREDFLAALDNDALTKFG